MPQGYPRSGEFYKHFKQNLYQVITVARHSETEEELVVYQALYGSFGVFARPLEQFISRVEADRYPDVEQEFRFLLVDLEEAKEIGKKTEDEQAEQISNGLHPKFIQFLDADTLEERYHLLQSMQDIITDEMINSMAVVLDLVVPEGQLQDRYSELKKCIQTVMKYQLKR